MLRFVHERHIDVPDDHSGLYDRPATPADARSWGLDSLCRGSGRSSPTVIVTVRREAEIDEAHPRCRCHRRAGRAPRLARLERRPRSQPLCRFGVVRR